MSARYDVDWSDEAQDDAAVIYDYLFERSPAAADAFLDEIESAAAALDRYPERGRGVPELLHPRVNDPEPQYRELILAPWRLIYRVVETTVEIVTIVDARRDLSLSIKRLRARR